MTIRVREDFRISGDFLVDGYYIDKTRLPHQNRASTSTIFVDSSAGDDGYTGDSGAPLKTLEEALSRVGDNFTGDYYVECRGAGPYTVPPRLPRPNSAGGNLNIVGDRSTVTTESATPAFSQVSGTTAQYESSAFSAHNGLDPSTHWLESDFTSFGATYTVTGAPVVATAAGNDVQIVAGFAFSTPCKVYPFTTTLDFSNAVGCEGAYTNSTFTGVRFLGLIIDGSSGSPNIMGCNFNGCKFEGIQARYIDCHLGGFVATSDNVNVYGTSSLLCKMSYFYTQSGDVSCDGHILMGPALIDQESPIVNPGQLQLTGVDFTNITRALSYKSDAGIEVIGDLSFSGGIDTIVGPFDSQAGRFTFAIKDSVSFTGTVNGPAVDLQNNSGAVNLDDVTAGLTVVGDEVHLDGTTFSFSDSAGSGVFDLTSGCYLRT